MINLGNIHSVTEFQRSPKDVLGKLKETKSPIVLTVNGKAEYVVQDAASYQEMVDKLEAVEDLEAVRQGYQEMLNGEGRPIDEFFEEFEAKHGLQR